MQETWVLSLVQDDPLEKEMATQSNILVKGGKGVGHNFWKNDIAQGHKINQEWDQDGRVDLDPWSASEMTHPEVPWQFPGIVKNREWVVAQILEISTPSPKSVQFSCSVMSDSLRPHGLQHARLPCPSPTPRGPTLLFHPSRSSRSTELRSLCHAAVSHHLSSCYCPQTIVNGIVYLEFLWGWI